MTNFKIRIIQPFAKFIVNIGGRQFLNKIGIDETKIADFVVKQVLDENEVYEVSGFKLTKGRTTRLPILTGEIDPAISSLIKQYVKGRMTVFDLGANFGWFSLLMAKQVGKQGHVYSFEAVPDLVKTINDNVNLNNFDNITVINKAISNKLCTAHFYIDKNYDTRGQLESKSSIGTAIKVQTITLDSFCEENNIKKVDFIKMDIEGSEPKAFEGMKNTIKSNPNIKIITEFNKYAMNSVGSSSSEFVKILDDLCLDFKQIDEKNPGNLLEISKNELENQVVSNVFCYNNESSLFKKD